MFHPFLFSSFASFGVGRHQLKGQSPHTEHKPRADSSNPCIHPHSRETSSTNGANANKMLPMENQRGCKRLQRTLPPTLLCARRWWLHFPAHHPSPQLLLHLLGSSRGFAASGCPLVVQLKRGTAATCNNTQHFLQPPPRRCSSLHGAFGPTDTTPFLVPFVHSFRLADGAHCAEINTKTSPSTQRWFS